jgi:hypothetical protein
MALVKKALLYLLSVLPVLSYAQAVSEEYEYLDISLSIFEMNLPEDAFTQKQLNIYPEVRAAESRYIPALLRATLQDSEQWGAIRIIPEIDDSAELMIKGAIIKSDGLVLEIDIQAIDSTGQEWINKSYSSTALDSVSLNNPDLSMDPFQQVYNQILTDLTNFHALLSNTNITQIKTMASLRYSAALSPDSFADYIQISPEGIYQYNNLPADNDPMVQRVNEIRQHEYLFTDVVDEQYQNYLIKIKPVYDLWRSYTRELVQNELDYQVRQSGGRDFRRGSYRDLKQSYDNFRWEKMQAQYLDQLSEGFSNETLSTEIAMEDSVYELTGTLENQYWEWQEILHSLFELEN